MGWGGLSMSFWRRRPSPFPRMSAIEILPNDRIVIELQNRITPEQAEQMAKQAAVAFGIPRARIIVVCQARVQVLRETDPPSPPVILRPGRA